jgi:membrane protease YdiL (CAAX protease family)
MVRNWIRRHPLLSFFVLAYGLNSLLAFIILGVPGLAQVAPVWLIPGATPTLSAILVCAALGGWGEIRRLLSGWFRFQLGWRWYLAALAFVLGPLLFALAYIALGHPPRGLAPGTTLASLAGSLLMTGFGAPLGEEAGWRGFALPRLQQRHNALVSSVLLGLLWAFWHIPFYIDPEMAADHIPFGIFIAICIVLSILFTWIYNNTRGSLVGPMLAHFCFNVTGSLIAGRLGLVPPLVIYIAGGVMLTTWALLVVVLAKPAYFSRRPAEALPFRRLPSAA